jgi:hypothetical protein
MSIELGISRYQVRDSNGKLRTVTDYLDAELNDDAVEGILQAGYQMYKVCLRHIKTTLRAFDYQLIELLSY